MERAREPSIIGRCWPSTLQCPAGLHEELSPELKPGFIQLFQQLQARDIKYFLLICILVCMFFFIVDPPLTPLQAFIRYNNLLDVALCATLCLLRVARCNGNTLLSKYPRLELLDQAVALFGVMHNQVTASMTWERAAELLALFTTTPLEVEGVDVTEPECVLYSAMGIFCTAHLHILNLRGLLLVAVFAPGQWALQCLCLGSTLSIHSLVKMAGVFVVVSVIAFVGGRRTFVYRLAGYKQRHGERLQMMKIFAQTSVPIFLVGRPLTGAPELQVELWNAALEELTQVRVAPGMRLCDVTCLRSASSEPLLQAISKALGEDGERTVRKLVPIVAAPGVVWVQVDVYPIQSSDGMKAIVIGSDVTEFVTRHMSLLHGLKQPTMRGSNRARTKTCRARLHPETLEVIESSPDFGELVQGRTEGQSFLDLLSEEDHRNVRSAAQIALNGKSSPCFKVNLRNVSSSLWHRRQSRSFEAGPQLSEKGSRPSWERTCQKVRLQISQAADDPMLLVHVLSDKSNQSQTMQRRDSGGTLQRRDSNAAISDRQSMVGVFQDDGATMGWSLSDRTSVAGAAGVRMESAMLRLVELARHFNLKTYQDSIKFLESAALRLRSERDPEIVAAWRYSCQDWCCGFCEGGNDEVDQECQVCGFGRDFEDPSCAVESCSSVVVHM